MAIDDSPIDGSVGERAVVKANPAAEEEAAAHRGHGRRLCQHHGGPGGAAGCARRALGVGREGQHGSGSAQQTVLPQGDAAGRGRSGPIWLDRRKQRAQAARSHRYVTTLLLMRPSKAARETGIDSIVIDEPAAQTDLKGPLRLARDEWLGRLDRHSKEFGSGVILTGHNLEGQVETLMLRLGNSSTLEGLCPTTGATQVSDRTRIVRPLVLHEKVPMPVPPYISRSYSFRIGNERRAYS